LLVPAPETVAPAMPVAETVPLASVIVTVMVSL
jgi:hypothetical protein